jgi:hypothetical protein
VKTLIGNGWLRESPKNLWPKGWDIKSRSALRKCVFLPVPPEAQAFLQSLPPPKPFQPVPLVAHGKRPDTPVPRRNDGAKNARMFAAVSPEQVAAEQKKRMLLEARRVAMGKKPLVVAADEGAEKPRPWYDDPIALGTLLILLPPVGLAAVWSSKRYSSDARWALTVMTGLTMFLVAAVFIAVTALAR